MMKYKYGDTFFDAFVGRILSIYKRARTEYFYALKWMLYWVICAALLSTALLVPFEIENRFLVNQYLLNRYQYSTKYSYTELLRLQKKGLLNVKLKVVLSKRRTPRTSKK